MADVENVGGIGIELRITDGTEGQIGDIEERLKTLVEPKAIPVYLQAKGFKAVEDRLQALADKMSTIGSGNGGSNPQNDMDTQVARAFNTGIDKFTTALANIQIAIQPESIAAIGRVISEAFGEARMADARGPRGGAIGLGRPDDPRYRGQADPLTQRRREAGDSIVRYWGMDVVAKGTREGVRQSGGPNRGSAEPAGRPRRDIDAVLDHLRDIAENSNRPRAPRVRALFSQLRQEGGEDLLRETIAPGGPWDWYKGRRAAGFRRAGFGTPQAAAAPAAEPEPTVTCPTCQGKFKPRGLASHQRSHRPPAEPTPRVIPQPRAAEPIPPSAPGQWQRQTQAATQAVREKDELTGEYLIQADPKGRKTGRYIAKQRRVEGRARGRIVTLSRENWFDISRPLPKLAAGRAPTLDELGAVNQAGYQRTIGVRSLLAGQYADEALRIPSLDSQTGRAPGLPRYRYSYWPGQTIGGETYSPRDAMLSGRLRQLAAARAAGAEPERIAELERRARGRIRVLTRGLPRDTRMQISRRILSEMIPDRELDLIPTSRGAFGMGAGTIQARLAETSRHQAHVAASRRMQAQAPELTAEAHQLMQAYVEGGGTLDYKSPGVARRVAGTGKEYQGAERAQLEFPAALRGGGELARTFRRVLEESRTGQIGPAYRLLTPEAVAPMVPGAEPLEKKAARLRLLRMPISGPGSELLQSVLGPRFRDLSGKLAPTVPEGPLAGQGLYRVSTAERVREELVDRLGLQSADELTSEKNPELRALYTQFETYRRSLPQSRQRLATEGMAVWQRGPTFRREETPFEATVYDRQGKAVRTARFHRDRMRAGGARAGRERDARAWSRYQVRAGLLRSGGRLGRLDLTGRGLDMPDLTGPDVTYAQNIRERVQRGEDLPFADEAVNKALNMLALYKLGPVDMRRRPEDKLLPEVSASDIAEYLYGRHIRAGETEEQFGKRGGYQAGLIDILGKPSQLVQRAAGITGRGFGIGSKDRRRLAPMASTLFQAIRHEVGLIREYRAKDESGRQGRAERAAGFVAPSAPGKYTGLGIPRAEAELYSIQRHPHAGRLQRAQDVLVLKEVERANAEAMRGGQWTETGADLNADAPGRGPTFRRAFRPAPGFLTGEGLPTNKANAKRGARRGRPVGEPINQGLTEEERARTAAQDAAERHEALIDIARPMDEAEFRSLPGGVQEQRRVAAETAIARRRLLTERALALPSQGRRARRVENRLRKQSSRLDEALAGTFAPIAKPVEPAVETAAATVAAASVPPAAATPPPVAPTPPVATAAAAATPPAAPRPSGPDPRSFLRSDGVIRVYVVDGKIEVYGAAAKASLKAATTESKTTGGTTAKAKVEKPKEPEEKTTEWPKIRYLTEKTGTSGMIGKTEPVRRFPEDIEERVTGKRRGARESIKRMPSVEEIAAKLAGPKPRETLVPFNQRVQERYERTAATAPGRGGTYYTPAGSTAAEHIRPLGGSPEERIMRQMALREELAPLGLRPSDLAADTWGTRAAELKRRKPELTAAQVRQRIQKQVRKKLVQPGVLGPDEDLDEFMDNAMAAAGLGPAPRPGRVPAQQNQAKILRKYGLSIEEPVTNVGATREVGTATATRFASAQARVAQRKQDVLGFPMRALSTGVLVGVSRAIGPFEAIKARQNLAEKAYGEYTALERTRSNEQLDFRAGMRARRQLRTTLAAGVAAGTITPEQARADFEVFSKPLKETAGNLRDLGKRTNEAYKTFDKLDNAVIKSTDNVQHFAASFVGGIAGGFVGAIAGMIAQPLIQAVGVAVEKIGGPMVDQMLGFTMTRQRTMGELAQQTEAAGGMGAVAFAQKYQFAPQAVTASLAPTMAPQAETIAAAKQFEAVRDAFRSVQGMQSNVPSALYTTQGPLGNPLLADYKSITELINSQVTKLGTGQESRDLANRWFSQVVNPALAQEGKYTFRRGNKQEIEAARVGMRDIGLQDVNNEGFVAIDVATGNVVTSFEDLVKVAASLSGSFTRLSPEKLIAQRAPQLQAQIGALGVQRNFALDWTNPMQRGMNWLTQPLQPFGTSWMPGTQGNTMGFPAPSLVNQYSTDEMQAAVGEAQARLGPVPAGLGPQGYTFGGGLSASKYKIPSDAMQSFNQYKSVGVEAFKAVEAAAERGIQALRDAKVPESLISDLRKFGAQAAAIQAQMSAIQIGRSETKYQHDLAVANRALNDAKQLTGQIGKNNSDNVGYYEQQLLLINRASTALSLQLQQRQITTQQAIAGFAVQGDTPEIRMARRKEAMLEADIANRQLSYSKQAFGTEIKLVDAQNVRGLQEAAYALKDLKLDYQAGKMMAALQDDLALVQAAMQSVIPDAQAWEASFTGYKQIMIGLATDIAAQTGKNIEEMIGVVEKGLSELQNQFPWIFGAPGSSPAAGMTSSGVPAKGANEDSRVPVSSSTTDNRSYKVENKPVFNIEVKSLDEETVADLTTKVVKSINTALALVGIRPVAR